MGGPPCLWRRPFPQTYTLELLVFRVSGFGSSTVRFAFAGRAQGVGGLVGGPPCLCRRPYTLDLYPRPPHIFRV